MVEQSLMRRQSCHWLATHHFGPYLVWRAVGLGPTQSIGWSCQAQSPIYFIPTVLLNLHLQEVPNPYLLVARRRWLRINCVENRNLTSAENLKLATARNPTYSSILVAYHPSQPRRMGYPLGSFPTQVELRAGWWSSGPVKIYSIYGVFKQKSKRNLSESDSENEAADLPRFIVIESLEEVCLAKFSPFLIEKSYIYKS